MRIVKRVALVVFYAAVSGIVFWAGSMFGREEGRQRASRETEMLQIKLDAQYEAVHELQQNLRAYEAVDVKISEARPDIILTSLDAQIDLLAAGNPHAAKGSFTDYVIPSLIYARDAGVSAAEIQARLNRIHALAKKGIYWSSFMAPSGGWSSQDLDEYFAELKKNFGSTKEGNH